MTAVVYDAGALIAADRNDRRFWAEHYATLEANSIPITPAAVVAQVSRSPRQAQLRRLLRGCEIAELDESAAHAVGELLGLAGTTDVVDGVVAHAAVSRQADIITSDRLDLQRLLDAIGATTRIVDA